MYQIFLVLVIIFPANCDFTEIEFLKDFFSNKNVLATVNTCWNYEKNKMLLKEVALSSSKMTQFGIHKGENYDINLLKKWTNNDFFVLDMISCVSSETILDELNETNIFVYPVKYLLLVENSNFPSLSAKLNQYQILPNCEFILAVFTDSDSAVLYQPYKVDKFTELTWENYGNWSLEAGLVEYFWNIPTSQRRIKLKRANLVMCVVIFENDTVNHLTDYMYPGVDTFTKQDFEPMMCVLQHMDFNATLTYVDNYGYIDEETGEFSGLVREIQTGRADVSAGSIFFTAERYEAVDLIKQGNPHPIRFVVKMPSTSYIKNIFFITFNTSVWIASIVVMVIVAGAVFVILNWEAKHKEMVKQNKYGISDVTLIALEAVCQQGTSTEPQSFAGRILALILFGAFMFIYVSYSANIVVLLQSTTKINSIQELLESRIEAGGCQVHYMKNYFESVRKGPLRQLYLQKIYPNQYFPLEVGMKKVQNGNFAFHVLLQSAYEYILQHFTNHEICGLQELPGYIEESLGYTAIPKHSPYKDLFKVALLKVDEYGLQRRTNLRIFKAPKCFSQAASFKSIGFYDCEIVLWIWVCGTGLALLVFVGELLLKKFAKKICNREKTNFRQNRLLLANNGRVHYLM